MSCPRDARSSTPIAVQSNLKVREASRSPRSLKLWLERLLISAGRVTSNSRPSPPTMVKALSRTSQRNTGSRGDWISGSSTASIDGSAVDMGSPTENTKAPRTVCPSTVERFRQATV
jgi:hypothetical protein